MRTGWANDAPMIPMLGKEWEMWFDLKLENGSSWPLWQRLYLTVWFSAEALA